MHRLHLAERQVEVAQPGEEADGGARVGRPGVRVANPGGKELEEGPRGVGPPRSVISAGSVSVGSAGRTMDVGDVMDRLQL